jgi:peptidoglycan/xylan/chitin deacetylase (PgdA/CDA1 family)
LVACGIIYGCVSDQPAMLRDSRRFADLLADAATALRTAARRVVSELNRRRFFGALSAAVLAGVGVAHSALGAPGRAVTAVAAASATQKGTGGDVVASALRSPQTPARVALPGGGMLNRLAGRGDLIALTLDDGVSTDVVRLYTEFARDTGVRLTYFVNGTYDSWTRNLSLLRPLVESGQIQLGNHTWSHPNLTTVPTSRVAQEITRNDAFLKKTYGVDAAPYFRPPYGSHNSTVDAVAASLGYTATTLWCGSLADSTVITEAYIVRMAERYFTGQAIVLGHLNHLPVTHVYGQLHDLIRARHLRTVTLNDVFLPTR